MKEKSENVRERTETDRKYRIGWKYPTRMAKCGAKESDICGPLVV